MTIKLDQLRFIDTGLQAETPDLVIQFEGLEKALTGCVVD